MAAAISLATAWGVLAAPLKVDINNSGRAVSEGLDPAFTPWSTALNWFAGGNTTSATFSGVTVKFTRMGSVGTALQTGYWKPGVQSTDYNVKLTADGLKVNTGDTQEALGSQIEMRITGLSAGAHTLLLYLSNWDSNTSVAPLDILVNGTQVVNDLAVSTQVTDNNNATTSYLNVTAVAGQDVVILIKAETSGSQSSKNVHINGFEIDTPNAKAQANHPVPDNADEHVNADSGSLTLGWSTAVLGAASHNVYFGTSSSAVENATTSSPEFKANQTTNSYPVSGINPHLDYYWRIDEVASGGAVTKGNVWFFRPRRLAFPGAEGYGRFARGGRGGVVRYVTNLNDSGAGSLRDAILGNYGPRTVVFDVSGLITLQDDIIIGDTLPYITIAGQTAPGKGICVKRQQFGMSGGRDIILRHVRGLVGKESGETQNATGMSGVDHCIMDHCSFGWGIDEGLSTRGGKNLTFQRCSLSEALNVAGHQNYPAGTAHGYAASIGGDIGSFHHNLLAHNAGRNWSLAGGLDAAGFYSGRMDIFNNVVYNWDNRTTDGGAHEVNFVNNYYKRGPVNGTTMILNAQNDGFPGTQQYYFAGNLMPGYVGLSDQTAGRTTSGPATSYPVFVNTPFFPSYATIDTAQNAYKKVLSDVGCNLPQIDNHDTRVITESLNGTYSVTGSVSGKKGLPDKTSDLGGWENYGTAARPANWDSDQDGMPNWWETIKGLNTASSVGDFSESNGDSDGNGYTNLEEYLNWMAAPNADCVTTVDVDLAKLSRGYTSSPVYTLSGPVNGTVAIVNTNKARFTASNPNSAALGSFTFTVTDSAGDSMTRTVGVRILGSGGIPAQAAPTGLTATASGTQVTLNWTASPGASSYRVKRSTVNGDPFPVTVALPASTTHVNTGLANGTYYYIVTAIGTGGESSDSAQVSGTIVSGPPAAPSGLTATAGNAQVSVSWTAVAGATSYNVKRATVSGGPYTTVASPTSASYVNTGLTNGTAYHYVVSAVNSGGEGANSGQSAATPQLPATPSAPTGLSATGGNTQVSLGWAASSGATSYNVKRATVSGGPYTTVASPTGTSYLNSGLTNGTAYYYFVSAVNSGGESANSSQVTATPLDGGAIGIVDSPGAIVSGSGTGFTTPVTVTPGANVLVVLIGNMKETSQTAIPTVTWNGQTLTNAVLVSSGSTGAKSCIFYLYNPATDGAAHELSCTFTAGTTGWRFQHYTLSGVDTAVVPLPGSVTGSTATITCTVNNCPANGLAAINALYSNNASPVTLPAYGSGILNALYVSDSNPTCALGYANSIAAGTDTFSAITTTASAKFALTVAVFTPASSAPVPEVNIEATDTIAEEYGTDQILAFTISRTGATTSALTVPLVASGNATPGSDYSGFASAVTIPIGQDSIVLPLTALADALAEGPETVTISLGASANFTVGTPSTTDATIDDKPSQAFYFGLVADPAKRGPNDDGDDDSIANIIEYFMGSHPGDGSSRGTLTIPSTGQGTFKVRYPRAKDRADVSGSLRWSADLGNWFTSGQSNGTHTVGFTEAVVSDLEADPETVEATGTITGPGDVPKIFIRLSVQ